MTAGHHRAHEQERPAPRAAAAAERLSRVPAEQPILVLQRRIGNQATADLLDEERDREASTAPGAEPPAIVYDVLSRPGAPLDPAVRGTMESRFGVDFGSVRVHTDARAQQSAAAVGARAFTVGRDVVFGAPGFNANDPGSVGTLAHELTHTVQNRASPWQGERLELDAPDTEAEREAASAGATVSRELDGARTAGGAPLLMRQRATAIRQPDTIAGTDVGGATARAMADVLQHGSLRLVDTVAPAQRSALVDLQACVTGKRESIVLAGDRRLALLEHARAELEPILGELERDASSRAWLQREITPYLDRLADAVQLQIARERVARAKLPGERAIETPAEGTPAEKEALRAGIGRMIETISQLNEQVIRFRHDELHHFAKELAQAAHGLEHEHVPGVHKKPTEPGYLVEVQNLLVLLHGMLSLSDEELAHELNKPHGVLGGVASAIELIRITTEIVGGTLGVTFSFAAVVSKLSGPSQAAYAAQAAGYAQAIGLKLGNIVAGIEIAHGLVVVLDKQASDEKRLEGARDVASGTAWFVGSKIGGAAVGGAASTAILITYKELELMAQLYGEARTGIVGGWMNLAFETMADAGRSIAAAGTELVKAGMLANVEANPAQQQALARVEQEKALALAASVDWFLEQCRPTGYGAGAAYKPGAYGVLRPVFSPLLGRVGAKTPAAAAKIGTDVLAAIRWCFEHAEELKLKEAGYEPKSKEHGNGGEGEHGGGGEGEHAHRGKGE